MDRMQRTDLAVELQEDLESRDRIPGVHVSTQVNEDNDMKETRIVIDSPEGAARFGKPMGCYITIESEELRHTDDDYHAPMSQALYRHLREMMGDHRRVLVAGLGNRAVTPDALGPYVVDNLYITRHLLKEELIHTPYEISALAPGVMAQTGMETQELLRAVIGELKPDILIVIDALAAMNSDRLNKTIQLSDTGIAPGSGVGNHRKAITEESMGVKVIAIGVPTVISVPAIVEDAMEVMLDAFGRSGMKEAIEEFTDEERYKLAGEMLKPYLANMYVTPKNIDEAIKIISYTISEAINHLHHSYI